MNFIKRNKKLLVVITVFLVALVAGIQLKNILYPSGGAIYGNRLDGIEEVKLAEDLDKQIQEKLKDFVSKVEVRTSGRIVNITMIVNPDISSSVAKDNSKKIIGKIKSSKGIGKIKNDGLGTFCSVAYVKVGVIFILGSERPIEFNIK